MLIRMVGQPTITLVQILMIVIIQTQYAQGRAAPPYSCLWYRHCDHIVSADKFRSRKGELPNVILIINTSVRIYTRHWLFQLDEKQLILMWDVSIHFSYCTGKCDFQESISAVLSFGISVIRLSCATIGALYHGPIRIGMDLTIHWITFVIS